MKLPERTFYDLASAANWLGCSDGDLDYYLKDDQLRYALPRKAYDDLGMASFDLLPDQVQEKIKRLRSPYLEDCFEIKMPDPDLLLDSLPDFLYWKHSWMKGFYKTVDEGEYWSCRFETFDGDRVSLWLDNTLHGCYLHRLNEDGEGLEPRVVSLEELRRFSGKTEEDTVDEPLKLPDKPFELPNKPDEIALAMVEFGNRYYQEKGKVPSALQLANYMLEFGAKDLKLSYDSKGKDYIFSDKPLAKRAFSDRLKGYKVSN